MQYRRDPVGRRLELVENAAKYMAAQSRISTLNQTRLHLLESLRRTYCPLGGTVHESLRRRKGDRSVRLIYQVYLESPPRQSILALWPTWPRPLCTITINSAIDDDEEFDQLVSALEQEPIQVSIHAAR